MSRYALKIVHETGRDYAAYIERPGQTAAAYQSIPDCESSDTALTRACEHLGINRETSRDTTGITWDLYNLA